METRLYKYSLSHMSAEEVLPLESSKFCEWI